MEEKRKLQPWLIWVVVAMVLLIAYPLSIGPVSWLAYHDYFVEDDMIGQVVVAFYWPLTWFAVNEVEPFHRWIQAYRDLWV